MNETNKVYSDRNVVGNITLSVQSEFNTCTCSRSQFRECACINKTREIAITQTTKVFWIYPEVSQFLIFFVRVVWKVFVTRLLLFSA